MTASSRYLELRARLRDSLGERETLLECFRMLRYALLQGPWRAWLIRHYRAHDHNLPLPVCADSLFPDVDVERVVRELDRGAYAAGFQVPEDMVERIVAYSRAVDDKRIDDPHLDCEEVQRIAHDPTLVRVARGYLGAEPILFNSRIYWTIPPADERGRIRAAAERGRFHYDLADIKALTVFVYLTDVDADCGPHVVIQGSQRGKGPLRSFVRFIGDDEIHRRYGDRIQVITGTRGTGWFEDITCFHKQAAAAKVRLMLAIIYTLHRRPQPERMRRPVASTRAAAGDRARPLLADPDPATCP